MDPNETLRTLTECARIVRRALDEGFPLPSQTVDALAQAAIDLDERLSRGGFPPDDWSRDSLEATPRTVTGLVFGGSDVESFTVAGLIAKLREQVAIDPTRAADPVTIWLTDGSQRRLVPVLVAATGNDDPAVGGPRQVWLHGMRQKGH